jgi:hypothetical protein
MVRHYVDDTDEELWQGSNRTYYRLISGLSTKVARQYGYDFGSESVELQIRLRTTVATQDWKTASKIIYQLATQQEEQAITKRNPLVAETSL